MRTQIHINQHVLKRNSKTGERKRVITAKTYKSNTKANHLAILDDSGNIVAEIIYSPDKPLKCGAKCWVETTKKIKVLDD